MFLKSCFLNYLSEVFLSSQGLHGIYKTPTRMGVIYDLYNNRVGRAKIIKRIWVFNRNEIRLNFLNRTAETIPQLVSSSREGLFGKLLILL